MVKWQIHLDLQCPHSKRVFDQLDDLKAAFGDEYEISVVLTALPFHHNAFYAMQGAYAVESLAGAAPLRRHELDDSASGVGECRRS